MRNPKYVLCNVFLLSVFTWECIMVSRGHWFRPTIDRLEHRRVPSDTTTGLSVGSNDGVIVSEPPEMPNGMEAFVPEGPASINLIDLIPDVLGNFPGDPNYMSGRPPEIPAEAPASDNTLLPFWQGVAP